MCRDFSSFFHSKVENLKSTIPDSPCNLAFLSLLVEKKKCFKNIPSEIPIHHSLRKNFFLNIPAEIPIMSVAEVYGYLFNLKLKMSSGLDAISSQILRCVGPVIHDSLNCT